MGIRPRRASDVDRLVALADTVRALDRWPPHRVGSTEEFVFGDSVLHALVAEDQQGLPVGHVAVHEHAAAPVMNLAAEVLGVDADQIAVVARLFVDPEHRQRGIGRMLLDGAVDVVTGTDRQPILDVWTKLDGAVALYERAGWWRLGEVTFALATPCGSDCLHIDGQLRSFVYASPSRS